VRWVKLVIYVKFLPSVAYQNQLVFHEVTQEIKVARFLLRHSV